jgi:hypothetical protein
VAMRVKKMIVLMLSQKSRSSTSSQRLMDGVRNPADGRVGDGVATDSLTCGSENASCRVLMESGVWS